MANDMKKGGFVERVYKERGGKAADPDLDVQPGRGARSIQRNLVKAVTRGSSSMKQPKGK
jgi:hypothetical protein